MNPRNNILKVRPIGRVRAGAIRIHRRYLKALEGIDGFSHIIVLYWLDKARRPSLRVHPKGLKDFPLIGSLATRTPRRFNPIGMSVVPLCGRKGTLLKVKNLDAWDGTPVLDIKPYTRKDSMKNIRVPGWVRKLDSLETDPLRRYSG